VDAVAGAKRARWLGLRAGGLRRRWQQEVVLQAWDRLARRGGAKRAREMALAVRGAAPAFSFRPQAAV
jgi:hypothetical protein